MLNVTGTISSRDRADDLRVGATGTIMYGSIDGNSRTWTNSWCLGTGVLQHDVDCFGVTTYFLFLPLFISRVFLLISYD